MIGDGIMSEHDGFKIGFPELYGELRQLGDKLTEYIHRQDMEINSMNHRINELTKDFEAVQARLEAERTERIGLRRQFWFSLLSSLLLPIVVVVVGGFLMAKGG